MKEEIKSPTPPKKETKYKTDAARTKSNAIQIPSISLPKGGGAVKGIDEKFKVNAANGTASFSVPLPVSKARGAVPELSLSYNSGGGNGIFGLGWSLNLPSIKRKSDKKLPEYNDYIESDTYLLSEAEDLVPEFERDNSSGNEGKLIPTADGYQIRETTRAVGGEDWTIRFYKPRIEGGFARIERWTNDDSGVIRWRVISKDNVTTLYGWSADGRSCIADQEKNTRIYEWLPEYVFDDKGNCAYYEYAPEDDLGFDDSKPHNANRKRGGNITYTNRYPVRVIYGNRTPRTFSEVLSYEAADPMDPLGDDLLFLDDFMFETAFDYGQYDLNPPFDLNSSWFFRPDAFSEYRAGFEIRTTRICRRVMLFHHFPGEFAGEDSALVKSLDLAYDDNGSEGFMFLKTITQIGYIRLGSSDYSLKSLPAIVMSYSAHEWNGEVKEISRDNLLHAPAGLTEPYQLTDLFNEGLPGILSEQSGAWFYKRNMGGGEFTAAEQVSPKPSFGGLNGGSLQLLDLESNGVKSIVNFSTSPQGYFEITDDEEFEPMRRFHQLPNINLNDANAKLIDLNGDGKTDVLISDEGFFRWLESAGNEGFSDFHRTPMSGDEEEGPRLLFSNNAQSIYLADMSGDGLQDIVRIRNCEVCYWPNLGFGRFGRKVVMDNAPVFDSDADFNPAYLKTADIDGSGTTDLIYLGKNKFTCWLNLNGNAFYPVPFETEGFPQVHRQANIQVADLLGTGLSCIVWSSALEKDAAAPLRYIDLMDSKKPHILTAYRNGLGLEVSLEYTPSTKFFIEDKKAGKPWATKLHFLVQCLSKVVTADKVTGNTFTSTYTYHHGYYDHPEREFRGFGRVDQLDTEITEHFENDGGTLDNVSLNQAPVLTKSWFHTGAWIRDKKILDQFSEEYWYEEYGRVSPALPSFTLVETPLPPARIVPDGLHMDNQDYVDDMSPVEKREAYRACKSMPLRVEVFALEGTAQQQAIPFTVATHNCMVELLQPSGQNRHAVFCVKESEAITYNYERDEVEDPRIAHTLNLKLDVYGNVLESVSVAYARLQADISLPSETRDAQDKNAVIHTVNTFTNDVNTTDDYRLRLPSQTMTYELTGLTKSGDVFTVAELNGGIADAVQLAYEDAPTSGEEKRLIEHVKYLYYKDDLTAALAQGTLESKGLPFENYQLAYTNDSTSGFDLLGDIFSSVIGSTDMAADGKFTQSGNDWWIRSGVTAYITGAENNTHAAARFYVPQTYTDPRNNTTTVTYDADNLFVEYVRDALSNEWFVVKFDYRTLTPVEMKDQNDNLSEVLLDELGLPKALILKGKGSEGDEVNDLTPETLDESPTYEQTNLADYLTEAYAVPTDSAALQTAALTLLDQATARFVYDFECYDGGGNFVKPAMVSTILREEHYNVDSGNNKTQISFEYSSGSGKVIAKKVQAEPGAAQYATISGSAVTITPIADTSPDLRWIGTGRTIFNNKGNPVKQYEPYFSATAGYEDAPEMVEQGVTPLLHYDAIGRLVRTDFPDGTFSKTEYFGWKQVSYDQNDTVDDSDWYTAMQAGSTEEIDASDKASAHYNTPKTVHFDTLGRPVLEQEILELSGPTVYNTRLDLDIEGNLRAVVDARGNTVMQYKYDMLGLMVYQQSMDSGQRWLLHDCMQKPLRTWDERSHEIQYAYDALNRPSTVKVIGGDSGTSLNNVVDKYVYGEAASTPKTYNLRGNLYRHWDTGGLEETPEYNFKNKPLKTERWLAKDYKNVVDWTSVPSPPPGPTDPIEQTSFVIETEFDALERIKLQTAPDGSRIVPVYSARGVLFGESVDQSVSPAPPNPIDHLVAIEYDAKGQRMYVEYGNGVYTEYSYDPDTFRLVNLVTTKPGSPDEVLQDLRYWYDAVGNITWKHDAAIPNTFYNNDIITGDNEYTYDALYRLTEATGRESHDMIAFGSSDNWTDNAFMHTLTPGNNLNLHNYTQYYSYDAVGNITQLQHSVPPPDAAYGYTRDYEYETGNNRLKRTTLDGGTSWYNYTHHTEHGFITSMPHLFVMDWNWKEELVASTTQAGANPEMTYYQYDSRGKRLRKITETSGGAPVPKNMRIYIEGYEYYEDFGVPGTAYVTETLSLIDDGQRFVMIENTTQPHPATALLTRYIHPNHQGSCTLETNDNGDIITYEEYHPFGTTSYQATNSTLGAQAKRYRYTGMERDDETGLNYHNARYYIPWLGRWLNPDPIGIGDGVNVYGYCWNNPVTHKDVLGTQTAAPNNSTDLLRAAGTANNTVNPAVLQKAAVQNAAAADQAKAAETAKAAAAHNKQMGAQLDRDKMYGPSDPQFHVNKGDNEMAQLVATRNLSKQEGGAMGALIGIGYGLNKVGQLGAPHVASKTLRGIPAHRPEGKTKNFGAPIEPVGKLSSGGILSTKVGKQEFTAIKIEGEFTKSNIQLSVRPESLKEIFIPGGITIGKIGSKESIRELGGGVKEAKSLFDRIIAAGGKVVEKEGYSGIFVQLPGGGTVGFRSVSARSPKTEITVDVNIPDVFEGKLKFNPE